MNTKQRTVAFFVLVTSLVMLSCAFVQSLAPASDPASIPEAAATEIPALEPTSTLRPTATARPIPTATPKPFAIQDESFQEYEKDCNTDVNINSVEADGSMGITVNSTITMLDGGWAVFCYGAKHTWIGTLTYAGYTFASDANDPLLFMVDQNKGYVYIKGSGTVTSPDGSVVNLGNATAAPAPSADGMDAIPTDWNGIPIMPGALSAEDYMGDYRFTTKASVAEIKDYYNREMANLGWELRQAVADTTGSDLAFVKDNTFVFFMVAPESDDNIVFIHMSLP